MDAGNPVVALCAQGMQAEAGGRSGDARGLFDRAWLAARDDYERCVAAHYVARHQDTPADTLAWNLRCLELADAVGDERVAGFYPSLHLNIGQSHEDLGDPEAARLAYRRAAAVVEGLPQDDYGRLLRDAVARGLERVATS
jgi:hypothetical protein